MHRFLIFVCIFTVATPVLAQVAEPSLAERVEQLERELKELKSQPAPALQATTPNPQPENGELRESTAHIWQDTLHAPENLVVTAITATTSKPATPLAAKVHPLNPSETKTGMGPTASKVYFNRDQDYVFGLSSEFFTFKQQKGVTGTTPNVNRTNILSLAPSLGIWLDKRILFNAQVLFENGGAESSDSVGLQKGQAIVRTAYLEWMPNNEDVGIRIGHQLIPIGIVNTSADPTTYFGVLRPELERELIPSAWHENGISAWFSRGNVDLQAGVFSSLNSAGFRPETFLGGGRSQGQNSPSDDVMASFRGNARFAPFSIGASAAVGGTAQGSRSIRTGAFQLGEVHLGLDLERLRASGMLAHGVLEDAEAISILNSTTVSETGKGGSAQLAVEVIGGKQKLWLFTRYSHYNLAAKVPDTLIADPALNKTITTYGLSYLPLPNIVFKADYAAKRSGAGNDEDEFNLAAGFVF